MKLKIVRESKHISIIYTFNDRKSFPGGSRFGVKGTIPYFDQFLMSYESILENWSMENFTYDFHLIHSEDFTQEHLDILDKMNVTVHKVKNVFEPTFLKCIGLLIDIKCDFRLILDNDILALKEPSFDFTKDIQAQLGGSKWNNRQWENICDWLNVKKPSQVPIISRGANFNSYNINEYFAYLKTGESSNLFPYWNAGVLLVNNVISKQYGHSIVSCGIKYFKIPEYNVGYMGMQDILGVAANSITDNWGILPIGVNFIINRNHKNVSNYLKNNQKEVYLLHYINIEPEDEVYYRPVKQYQELIHKKYLK